MSESSDNIALINCLPVETFLEILLRIDGPTLIRCRRVCKTWMDVIDGSDNIWHELCKNEFKTSSNLAKKKCGDLSNWYHIYRNLKLWPDVTTYEKTVKEFYNFNLRDRSHVLDINYGILPLKDSEGTVFYDMAHLKYIPVALPERNCVKICNNDTVSVLLVKKGIIYVQRTVNDPTFECEKTFIADNFILSDDLLHFYKNRDVFKCNLLKKDLSSSLIYHSNYEIKELQFNNDIIYLFTDCGKILCIDENSVVEKPINCPIEWVKHIKNICAIDDRNFICYSRNLFKIETNDYQHLYLDFPPITALFFYIDMVLIGLRSGEILLYKLSSQKKASMPIFETLTVLPDEKFPVQLDVCERKSGPVIVASTFFELFLIEINFFPDEHMVKNTFTSNKMNLYKRLRKLKDILQTGD
ncbi:uncharacterized protein LOC126976082 [Leptidea sinapis]|uniref:uncharacterized protein LOC126976082 n=1 Tax=Leptidea sinapis TaxID=189913 RepID=UPI00213A087D|nr:uncharacterized protein LOC126976082 [Leptidea sinapis]XP_050680225.1 uncharacterized protein LOC126976082 [Leptidea sinapis]